MMTRSIYLPALKRALIEVTALAVTLALIIAGGSL